MDKLSKEQRHKNMAAIRSKDTKPEMIVRRWLWSRGFRYRLNHKRLPGHPDLVLRKYRTCIFVNGCFWHGHNVSLIPTLSPNGEGIYNIENSECCRIPTTNREYWTRKITRNIERDRETQQKLAQMRWHCITVWECELGKNAESRIEGLAEEIRCAGEARRGAEESRRKSRAADRREREEAIRRLGDLQAEVDALFDVPTGVKKASRAEGADDC